LHRRQVAVQVADAYLYVLTGWSGAVGVGLKG
jgi:hypothetical protein